MLRIIVYLQIFWARLKDRLANATAKTGSYSYGTLSEQVKLRMLSSQAGPLARRCYNIWLGASNVPTYGVGGLCRWPRIVRSNIPKRLVEEP